MIRASAIAFILGAVALAGTAAAEGNADFAGPYAAMVFGGAWGDTDSDVETDFYAGSGYFQTTSVPVFNSVGSESIDTQGGVVGALAGYGLVVGPVLLGLETDFQYFGLEGKEEARGLYPCCLPDGFEIEQFMETEWLYTLRARLGAVFGGVLVFASGGLAVTELAADFRFRDDFAVRGSGGFQEVQEGWTVGAGLEKKFGERWAFRAEYLHADFSAVRDDVEDFFSDGSYQAIDQKADLESDLLRFALSFYFD